MPVTETFSGTVLETVIETLIEAETTNTIKSKTYGYGSLSVTAACTT